MVVRLFLIKGTQTYVKDFRGSITQEIIDEYNKLESEIVWIVIANKNCLLGINRPVNYNFSNNFLPVN